MTLAATCGYPWPGSVRRGAERYSFPRGTYFERALISAKPSCREAAIVHDQRGRGACGPHHPELVRREG